MRNFDLPPYARPQPLALLGKPTRVTGMHVACYRRNFMSNRLHQQQRRAIYPLSSKQPVKHEPAIVQNSDREHPSVRNP